MKRHSKISEALAEILGEQNH